MKLVKLCTIVLLTASLSACSWFGGSSDGDLSERGLSESQLNMDQEARYGDGSIPMAEGDGLFRDVHFGYDSSAIDDQARQNLDYNAQILQQNSTIRIQLEGHCDERGTAEYNLALGARRADSVKEFLVSLGVPSSRLDTISYGEEVPLDPEKNEAAYARNRRVHFSAFTVRK